MKHPFFFTVFFTQFLFIVLFSLPIISFETFFCSCINFFFVYYYIESLKRIVPYRCTRTWTVNDLFWKPGHFMISPETRLSRLPSALLQLCKPYFGCKHPLPANKVDLSAVLTLPTSRYQRNFSVIPIYYYINLPPEDFAVYDFAMLSTTPWCPSD